MRKLHTLILRLHRILGTLLSCVFLMWFLTGIVMVYHGSFPRPDRNGRESKLEALGSTLSSLPHIDSLLQGRPYQQLTLDRYMGHTAFHLSLPDTLLHLTPTGEPDEVKVDRVYRQQVVKAWCQSEVARVDTLYELNQWIPFSSNYAQLPILKYSFNDAEQHELYMGLRTAKVLQFTTKTDRFWAWIGPIPHWIYFTWLRTNSALWSDVVCWIAGIGCFMILSGFYCAIRVWRKARQKRKFSPYKKKWYHWHYVLGFCFGLFCITYAFSGLMSLAAVPAWISKPSLPFRPQMEIAQEKPDSFLLDYRKVLEAYPQATQIAWNHVGKFPIYKVTLQGGEKLTLDASSNAVKPLALSEEEVKQMISSVYQKHDMNIRHIDVELVNRGELYYRSKDPSAYPAYKVTMNDADQGVFYVNPREGNIRYVDTTGRWGYWMYTALHTLRIPGIMEHEWLRQLLQWFLMLGGASVSLTGIVLGIRYLIRLFRKL